MTIKFYKNHSDNFEVPKNLTDEVSKTGTLREEAEVMQPTILMEFDPRQYNYCYIEDFGRYYYITGIESVRNGLWRVSCNRDPLQSFWDQIKEAPIITERSGFDANAFIKDDKRKFLQYTNNEYIDIGVVGRPTKLVMVTVGGEERTT